MGTGLERGGREILMAFGSSLTMYLIENLKKKKKTGARQSPWSLGSWLDYDRAWVKAKHLVLRMEKLLRAYLKILTTHI